MTAPALVLVANGSVDHGVNATMHSFRKRLQTMRPDMSVNVAFLDHCPPTGPQVVTTLAHRGVTELVFVPTQLTSAIQAPGVDELLARVRMAHPQLKIAASRPIGPATDLLNLLDERLRDALRQAHESQVDGLVLAAPDGGDSRGAALLQRRARQWSAHHKLPCYVAVNDGSGLSTVDAVAALRAQGRRHIAVGSLWITPDEAFCAQAQAAVARGAVAVSQPFGVDDRLLSLALGRYAYAAMSLLDEAATDASEHVAL